jgi:hypothetical protein
MAAGVVAMLVAGVGLTTVVTHHHHEAASSRPPFPADPRLDQLRTPANAVSASPAGDITATGRIEGILSPGDTLVFDVALQSSRTFTFHPCPAYTITFGTQVTTGRLSCAQMPYFASFVRPDGRLTAFRPVLPAGNDVVFRMQVRVPNEPGRRRVVWTLHSAGPNPVVSGVVQVTAAGAS